MGKESLELSSEKCWWEPRDPNIVQELCESRGWPSWAVRPNEPSGFRGRKAILNRASALVSACP